MFGNSTEIEQDPNYFLEGQAIIAAISAILFAVLAVRVILFGRQYHNDYEEAEHL